MLKSLMFQRPYVNVMNQYAFKICTTSLLQLIHSMLNGFSYMVYGSFQIQRLARSADANCRFVLHPSLTLTKWHKVINYCFWFFGQFRIIICDNKSYKIDYEIRVTPFHFTSICIHPSLHFSLLATDVYLWIVIG